MIKLTKKKLKRVIKEETQKILNERMADAYWVDPYGEKHKIPGLHIEWLQTHKDEYPSIPNNFDTTQIRDPDFAQRRFYPKGWVNLSVTNETVMVIGTKRHIEDKLNSIVFKNPEYSYTVVLYDRHGDPEEEFLNLSKKEFINKFGK